MEFEPSATISYFDWFALEGEPGSLLGRQVEATTRPGLKPWIRSHMEQDAQTIYHAA